MTHPARPGAGKSMTHGEHVAECLDQLARTITKPEAFMRTELQAHALICADDVLGDQMVSARWHATRAHAWGSILTGGAIITWSPAANAPALDVAA